MDAYLFPCPKCGDPAGQVRETIKFLNQSNAPINRLWFDIEGSQYWTLGHTDNFRFFESLVNEASSLNLRFGVYCNWVQWQALFGTAHLANANSIPLWYPHYDGRPDMSDFRAFGGWTSAFMKQFNDKSGIAKGCGVGADLNWTPHHY